MEELLQTLVACAPGVAAAALLGALVGLRGAGGAVALGALCAYWRLQRLPDSPLALLLGSNDGVQWLLWALVGAAALAAGARLVPWLRARGGLLGAGAMLSAATAWL